MSKFNKYIKYHKKKEWGVIILLKRGMLCWVDFGGNIGSEQGGIRPAVIVQNDMGNQHSPCTIVSPITSQPKTHLPTHISIHKTVDGLPQNSTILTEQIRTIDKCRIKEVMGYVSIEDLKKIDRALLISMGCYISQPQRCAEPEHCIAYA